VDFKQYKEQFIRERFVLLKKLDDNETESIPKSTKKEEYDYLCEKGIINDNGTYYWKKPNNLSETEISQYINMETVQLLSKIALEIENLKANQVNIEKRIIGLVVLVFLIVVLMIIFMIGIIA